MVKSVKTAKRNSKFYKLKHWKSSKYTSIEWKNKKYRYTYIDIHTRIIFVFISLDISCQDRKGLECSDYWGFRNMLFCVFWGQEDERQGGITLKTINGKEFLLLDTLYQTKPTTPNK